MAHSSSAKKRIRQNLKARARNRWRKRTMRDSITTFRERILHGSAADAESAYRTACKILDRTAQRGVIHKNTAARLKSRLNNRLRTKKSAG